ncbi:MAG: hypothetical protein NZ693_04235 [Thermoflexales bacterium]|nr:hypothetical protein [Thermoflexales bacterium]
MPHCQPPRALAGTLERLLRTLPADHLGELATRAVQRARTEGLTYWHGGREGVIPLLLRPIVAAPEQVSYLSYVSSLMLGAFKRLPDLYLAHDDVREVLPLAPEEANWLHQTWTPAHQRTHCVIGRLDAVIDFNRDDWRETLAFIEPNLVGAGGVSLIPAEDAIVLDMLSPLASGALSAVRLSTSCDFRRAFLRCLNDQLAAIGRRAGQIVFADAKYADEGPAEMETLRRCYAARRVRVAYIAPSELYCARDEVWCSAGRVDMLYRDYALIDLIDIADEGGDPKAVQMLAQRNQLVSSLAGDLDHKSTFELFTDTRFDALFSSAERAAFRRHVPWTRLLTERRTTAPNGAVIDLPEYALAHQAGLVIKPNRSYGGEGVHLGCETSTSDWCAAIERALAESGEWVVQQCVDIPAHTSPLARPSGEVLWGSFHVVLGLIPTPYGLGILGRASPARVVNVAQGGGLCAVVVATPSSN